MESHGWVYRVSTVGAVAVAGAVIGWVISLDVDWSAAASNRECQQVPGICIGTAPVVGVVFGVAFTVLVCWVVFAVARIRPLLLTVPAAVMLVIVAIDVFLRAVHDSRLHPAWAFSLVLALALVLLDMVTIGLRQLARNAF